MLNKQQRKLTLVIPSLFSTGLSKEICQQISLPEMPAFSRLFTSAQAIKLKEQNSYYPYLAAFSAYPQINQAINQPINLQEKFPMAVFSYLSVEKKPSNQWQWVYQVNTIHLHPDLRQVVLSHDLSNELSDSEAEQICQLINSYFNQTEQDQSWQLVYYKKNHWYLLSASAINWQTVPIDFAIGQVVQKELSHQAENAYWQQTLTEIQMLLFNCEVNQQRQLQQQVVVNSLWVWGGGNLTDFQQDYQVDERVDCVFTNNNTLENLAKSQGIRHQLLSSPDIFSFQGNTLIYLDDLAKAVVKKDITEVYELLIHYESVYFKTIKYALLQGELDEVCFMTEQNVKFVLSKNNFKVLKLFIKKLFSQQKNSHQLLTSRD